MNDMRRVHAEQLVSSLELSLPPVAIAFCDVVPDDVPMFASSAESVGRYPAT